MIHLGYETGTGRAVGIPLAHMAVTGQTQQSGKTTTLEALIDRGELRAVVFVTKPGEKSFTEGRRILPYFKERADWEYVKELLEARLNESLGSKVGYLMRACARARSLADVRKNIANELPKKKSSRPSMYEVLAGYIDLIIAEMERVNYTDKLDLVRGVNIMDLTGMSEEMQSLVIRSTIERIHKSERSTVLVMPEAWKFIPEGGRSPVFHALHALIREGATNGNFVWIDAQDLAVVSKRILKSVSVWVLGKQQEANEVARTINHLIEPLHIRPDMIKSLGIGQFLVCGDGTTRKVYVQPRWLGELDALAIARGEESVETAQRIFREKKKALATAARAPRQVQILEQVKPDAETKNHKRTDGRIQPDAAKTDRTGDAVEPTGIYYREADPRRAGAETAAAGTGRIAIDESEDVMWKERAEAAEAEVKRLVVEVRRLAGVIQDTIAAPANGKPIMADGDLDIAFIYQAVKRHAENDPGILQLLVSRPELRVQFEPKVLAIEERSLRGGLALLIHKGFFSKPQTGNAAFNELQRIGRKTAKPNVYRELDGLAELGFVTKEASGYQATDLKVTVTK